MKILKLIKLIVFRSIREEKFLSLLSIIGVALSIALFTGVKIASDRAVAAFESELQGINPRANYEILDISGIDYDENLYKDVLKIEKNSFPVIKVNGYIRSIEENIAISGIDTIKSLRFLKFPPTKLESFKDFYKGLNGVLITKKFADKYKLKKADTFKASIYDREYPLKVVHILDSDLLTSNTAIMDIGNFQEYFGKTGFLTRIDLITEDKKKERIQKSLPSGLSIVKKDEIIKNQKALLSSFHHNLRFLSLIAILVGVFLLYNTVFISVIKRRTEIGILRSLGTDKKIVMSLFTVQGIVLGMIGSLIGVVLGQVVAYFSIVAVEKTISAMYMNISISDYLVTKSDALKALTLGFIISMIASLIPSYESSTIRPNESSREGTFEGKFKGYRNIFAWIGVIFSVSGGVFSYLDYRYTPFEFPLLAYSGVLFIILGFTFIAPFFLDNFLKIVKRPTERIFGATGKITLGDIKGNVYRFSVALMSVAISGALIIAMVVFIFSFRNSLREWIKGNLSADVFIRPSSCTTHFCLFPLSDEVIKIIEGFDEVLDMDKFRALKTDLFGKDVLIGFRDFEIRGKYFGKQYAGSTNPETGLKESASDKEIAISEYVSQKYGLQRGDNIELKTPKGKKIFTIKYIFVSYSTTSGLMILDRKWLKEYWGLDDVTLISICLKKGAHVPLFIRNLRERISDQFSLEIINNDDLRKMILSNFDKSFAITYAIELIAIIVSLIGVINTLLARVIERKRDISIIRYLGGSWRQIRNMLTLSAGIVGISGIFLGSMMGLMISIIIIEVINRLSFGWSVHFSIPFFYLFVLTTVLLLTILTAGIIPSKVARKIDPKRFISFE